MCYHNLPPYNCWGNHVYYYYPLVIEHSYGKLMQIAIDSWFPYQKWWFSIAMLNYQRVWAARSVDPKGWLASGVRECHHSYTMLWKKLTSIKFHKTCTHKYGVFTVTYSIVINCFFLFKWHRGTLGRLLLRHYDPTCGAILFDGIDYRQLNLSPWDRQILDMF